METEESKLSGAQRSALILLALGQDIATEVFKNLNQNEIREIALAIESISNVDSDVVHHVFDHFAHEVSHDSSFLIRGEEFLEEVATNVLGAEKAKHLLGHLKRKTTGTLKSLSEADTRTLANIIGKEHPQTIALLLAHTIPGKASELIPLLPEDLQVETVMRIANLDNITPDIISDVEQSLLDEVLAMGNIQSTKAGGVDMVAEVLNQMDKQHEKAILEEITEQSPELADKIRQLMFVFEDLLNVDDRGIQALLKEIEHDQLAMALKTASEELKVKIFRNISSRAATMLEEDLEAMGPVRVSDVERAQMGLVQVAMRLEEEGRLVIAGGEGEDILV